MAGPRFIGHRLRVARTLHGLDQRALGERLGLGHALVGELEAGARQPAPEVIAALAEALGFGVGFFDAPLGVPRDEDCYTPASTPGEPFHGVEPEAARQRALAHTTLLAELVAWLEERVQLPPQSLPLVTAGDPQTIEATAAACRRLWGLAPDLPIPNLTRVVERAGVVVVRPRGAVACARVGRRPLVVLDAEAGARFSLARLVGHVVLRGEGGEAAAERFAGALLLPRDGLLRELPRAPSLDAAELTALAQRWAVSLALLVRRASELPIANAARYRDVAEHVSKTRGSAGEPDSSSSPGGPSTVKASRGGASAEHVAAEPEVLSLALKRLAQGLRIGHREVASRLGWSPRIFADVTGLDAGEARADNVVSLLAWKARREGARSAPAGGGMQLELDFGQ